MLTNSIIMSKKYCGAKSIPKGSVLGSPGYCAKRNQIRYYGVVAIDKELLNPNRVKKRDLTKELLKLRKLQDDAKMLIKEFQKVRIILERSDNASELKAANKRLDTLSTRRDKLVAKIAKQQIIVKDTQAAKEREENLKNVDIDEIISTPIRKTNKSKKVVVVKRKPGRPRKIDYEPQKPIKKSNIAKIATKNMKVHKYKPKKINRK